MKNLIGGSLLDSSSQEIIEIKDPATNELIDTVPDSTEEDVNQAVSIAKMSYKEWAQTPMHERGTILYRFVDLVEQNEEDLAQLLSKETGKPIKEARAELKDVRKLVYGFVEKAKHDYGTLIPNGTEQGEENTIQLTTQNPLGVVACIIPFNFPVSLFSQKVPSALIMGNAVIVKPSTYNPLTLHKLCELLIEAGIPSGVINCISGKGEVVGRSLASHKDVDLVSVTGSTQVGSEVMQHAAENITHVMLELGGNDAFILDYDGDIDLATEELVQGRLYNAGQVCCASKRFLIHENIKEEFINKVVEKISTLKVGMPIEDDTDIGCLINENAAQKVEEQVRQTINEGANILIGGRRKGAFFEPTIIDNVTKEMQVMNDLEIFGPVIPICTFTDIEEAIEIANQSSFGLSSCIFTKDMNKAFKVATKLESGGVVINGSSFYRSCEMPFGGWKHSGIGNEGISSTLKEMSHTKTIILKNILK